MIIAVRYTHNGSSFESKPWKKKKKSGLNGILIHDLYDTGAVLYQLSCQANLEQVTLWARNKPVDNDEWKWKFLYIFTDQFVPLAVKVESSKKVYSDNILFHGFSYLLQAVKEISTCTYVTSLSTVPIKAGKTWMQTCSPRITTTLTFFGLVNMSYR